MVETSGLKPSRHLLADVAMQENKNQSHKYRITVAKWNVRSMNTGKFSTVKNEVGQLHSDMLRISKWTLLGSSYCLLLWLCFQSQEGYSKNNTWLQCGQ